MPGKSSPSLAESFPAGFKPDTAHVARALAELFPDRTFDELATVEQQQVLQRAQQIKAGQ